MGYESEKEVKTKNFITDYPPVDLEADESTKSSNGKKLVLGVVLTVTTLLGLATLGYALGLKYSGRNITPLNFKIGTGVGGGVAGVSLVGLVALLAYSKLSCCGKKEHRTNSLITFSE